MTPYDYIVLAGVALLLTAMARCEPWPTLPQIRRWWRDRVFARRAADGDYRKKVGLR